MAVGVLVVIGVACLFSYSATVAGLGLTVNATVVDPAANAETVADASNDIVNLDQRLDDPIIDTPVESVAEAAETGTYNGSVDPAVRAELESVDAKYAVYDGAYYRWQWTTRPDGVRLRMEPVNATTVVERVATPYSEASPTVQRVIRTGSGSVEEVPTGVFVRDGTYYALTPISTDQLLGIALRGVVSYVLSLVGPGYLAVGLGLAAVRYHDPSPRPVTPRRAIAVAAVAVPVGVVVAATLVSGSVTQYVLYPGVASVVASGFVAGVFAFRSQWLALVGFTGLVGGLGAVVSVAVGGIGGLLVGLLCGVVGVVAGIVPFGYGVAFAADPG